MNYTLIGVSKCCCPACSILLDHLSSVGSKDNALRDTKFLTFGSHRTITACFLPPWLPDSVIDHMVDVFERKLGQVLYKVHRIYVLTQERKRRDSTSSGVSQDTQHYSDDEDLVGIQTDEPTGKIATSGLQRLVDPVKSSEQWELDLRKKIDVYVP